MKPSILRSSWLPVLVLCCGLAVSVSYAIRFYREENDKLWRLLRNLQEIQALRTPMEQSTQGAVAAPLEGVDEALIPFLQATDPMERTNLGMGWVRKSVTYRVRSLPEGSLGQLLESLQKDPRGWWVTGLTLEIEEEGLSGQLRLEALDKESAGE